VWTLFGVVCLALAGAALAGPDLGLSVIAALFGGYLLTTGLLDGFVGLADEHADAERRARALVLAVLAMIAGLLCLRHPGEDLSVVVLSAGIYLIVAGALHIIGAFDEEQPRIGWALGGAYIVLGSLILALPALDLGTFAPLFGLAILARGAAATAEARRLRSARRTG
jgi:uncharacterized membrane protein HdeD (DUF308 family)